MQAKATETNLIHQEKEEEKEAGICVADLVPLSTLPSDSSNSSRLTDIGCHEEESRREEKSKEKYTARERTENRSKGNSWGKDPRTLKRNSQGGGPSPPSFQELKSGRKRRVHSKKEEVKASGRDGVIKKEVGKGRRRETE